MRLRLFIMSAAHARPARRQLRRRQSGFNFTEVLFAVMILGIGFIMIAAIFPVALQQTKATGEEVIASTAARGGVNYIQQVGLNPGALPDTVTDAPLRTIPAETTVTMSGAVFSFRDFRITDPDDRDALWKQVSGNLILPSDERTAWVGFFRRGARVSNATAGDLPHTDAGIVMNGLPYAQVFVFGVQIRNRSSYNRYQDVRRYPDDGPGAAANNSAPATLEPRVVFVKLHEGNANPDQLTFHDSEAAGAALYEEPAAAEGAYVLISDDQFVQENIAGNADGDTSTTTVREINGTANGRIYRLGRQLGMGTWELAPGDDMIYRSGGAGPGDDYHENIPPRTVGDPPTGLPAYGFIVGRGLTDPTDPAGGFDGRPQDTAVFSGFITAN